MTALRLKNTALLLLVFTNLYVIAQVKKKGTASKTVHKPSSVLNTRKDSIRIILLPEFYFTGNVVDRDTVYNYEAYDFRDKEIKKIENIDDVESVLYLKSYYDRTRGDGNGIVGPPYYTDKLKIYAKIDHDTWICNDFEKKTRSQLQEYRNKIVRKDTNIAAKPESGNRILTIRRYYKVTETFSEPSTHTSHSHE